MDNMNFDDILKKAMEAEMKSDTEEETKFEYSNMKNVVDIISMGPLIKLSKAANERMVTVIKELKDDLNKINVESTAGRATLAAKITKTAKTIDVLNVLIATAAITGSATLGGLDSDKDMGKSLDTIIQLMLLR